MALLQTEKTDPGCCLPRYGGEKAAQGPFGGGAPSCSSPFAPSAPEEGIFIHTAMGRIIFLIILLAGLPPMATAELKPFQVDSLEQITAAREGRPFLLMLWSLDCPPCLKELAELRQLTKGFDARDLVLVSTDGPGQQRAVERTLRDFGLTRLDNWLFADDFGERLRYRIDPEWFGELPRAYFYAADHQRTARSGVLKPELLQRWLQQTREQGS